ncbi:condensation domain-containing protein [Nonomuraea fuscirosea]|uniref:condensation domain-containing protein n=1 Tax=Nonomuraea fuscirosea TaxID=1291556 RepID=UPI00344567ED
MSIKETGVFPLSPFQQIVWLQQHLAPDGRAYHASAVLEFRGDMDAAMLRKCIGDAVGRHDAMRIRICDDGSTVARQEVVEGLHVEIPEHDLRGAENIEERRAALLHQHVNAEFDLRIAPLVRWALVRLADRHWQLFVTEHHLVHDGRSIIVFFDDVLRQYSAEVAGKRLTADITPSYEDYVRYTASPEHRKIVDADVEWWKAELDGAKFGIEFAGLGSRRSGLFDFRGGQYRQALPAGLMDRVRAVARQSGHTVFAALLAVYAEICRRYSGQHDLVIGLPLANRPPEFERTVGMMVNAVPLRLAVDPGVPCSEVALKTTIAVSDAIDHESAPIQDLVRALNSSSKGLSNPLFNTLFGMHDALCPTVEVPGVSVDMQAPLSANSTKFDLSVIVLPDKAVHSDSGDRSYELVWEYSHQMFSAEDVQLLATGFAAILREYVAHPAEPIGSLALAAVAPSERDEHEAPRSADVVKPSAGTGGPAAEDGGEPFSSLWLTAFRDVLGRDDVNSATDFFRAGGYSLLVPELLSRYASLSGWRPPIRWVFEFSSPAELEAATKARRPDAV